MGYLEGLSRTCGNHILMTEYYLDSDTTVLLPPGASSYKSQPKSSEEHFLE